MSHDETNGKATATLVSGVVTAIISTVMFIAAVATPLILMYSKINALEVQYGEKFKEVETQFRAADEFRNVNLAGQMRFNSLLWQQSFGTAFPGEVYFPAIAKPSP